MPIVRADLPKELSDETKKALRQAIKAAIVSALAPKKARYIYVALRRSPSQPAGSAARPTMSEPRVQSSIGSWYGRAQASSIASTMMK